MWFEAVRFWASTDRGCVVRGFKSLWLLCWRLLGFRDPTDRELWSGAFVFEAYKGFQGFRLEGLWLLGLRLLGFQALTVRGFAVRGFCV